jgi:uncharacterized protein YjaZ
MEITHSAMAATLEQLLRSTSHPRERLARASTTILTPLGPGQRSQAQSFRPAHVMEAVMRDGYDLHAAQQVYGLFSPSRKIRASAWALDRLRDERVFEQAGVLLSRAGDAINKALRPASLQLMIIPADPSNRNLMIRNAGLSVSGGAGSLAATVWPSAGNLARLGAALVRGFALGVRWSATNAARRYTLADALAAEGLAAALVSELVPGCPAPWLIAHVAPASWPGDLQAIAEIYGVSAYQRVPANTYGRSDWHDLAAPPAAAPLDDEELAYAEEVIAGALGADDPRTIAAHLYGDAIAAEQGHPQAGLPPYAGFEVAYRLVRRSGQPADAALGLPTSTVLS